MVETRLTSAGGRMVAPKHVHILVSGTCEYVIRQRRIEVTDEIKVANQLAVQLGGRMLNQLGQPDAPYSKYQLYI